ncbi:hypothetical protein KYJ26_20370 [Bacillus sp. MCCB 382]|uniref:hypothetical protein n=1 Tax=Bacillus sp. MCCB 382 TaxID=2860197 RepID=UPI001C59409F|nr:hypothetical protein [Bacillus sp. MCCB 382]
MELEYFVHDITRVRLPELEKAVQEKLADGWEIHTPICPITKVGSNWGVKKGRKHSLDDYEGSYMTQKYFCRMKKERSKVLAGRNG